jgi:hypothetical protein
MEVEKNVLLNTGDNNPILVYTFFMIIIIFMTGILHASQKGVRISKYMKI